MSWSMSHISPKIKKNKNQEVQASRDCYCATLCFDHSGSDLVQRISNTVYEQARAGTLQLSNFPSFDPMIQALKSNGTVERTKSYRVTAQRHDQLFILENYARKWLDDPNFEEQTKKLVQEHNDEFNPEGGFLSERLWVTKRGKRTHHLHPRPTNYPL